MRGAHDRGPLARNAREIRARDAAHVHGRLRMRRERSVDKPCSQFVLEGGLEDERFERRAGAAAELLRDDPAAYRLRERARIACRAGRIDERLERCDRISRPRAFREQRFEHAMHRRERQRIGAEFFYE